MSQPLPCPFCGELPTPHLNHPELVICGAHCPAHTYVTLERWNLRSNPRAAPAAPSAPPKIDRETLANVARQAFESVVIMRWQAVADAVLAHLCASLPTTEPTP